MGSYITGKILPWEDVGKEIVAEIQQQEPEIAQLLDALVVLQLDREGDDQITVLAETPGYVKTESGEILSIHDPRWNQLKKQRLYRAYASVAIALSRRPTEKELQLLMARAEEYTRLKNLTYDDPAARHLKAIGPSRVLGFRLIEHVMQQHTTPLPASALVETTDAWDCVAATSRRLPGEPGR